MNVAGYSDPRCHCGYVQLEQFNNLCRERGGIPLKRTMSSTAAWNPANSSPGEARPIVYTNSHETIRHIETLFSSIENVMLLMEAVATPD
jgi:hypothetical protein